MDPNKINYSSTKNLKKIKDKKGFSKETIKSIKNLSETTDIWGYELWMQDNKKTRYFGLQYHLKPPKNYNNFIIHAYKCPEIIKLEKYLNETYN